MNHINLTECILSDSPEQGCTRTSLSYLRVSARIDGAPETKDSFHREGLGSVAQSQEEGTAN